MSSTIRNLFLWLLFGAAISPDFCYGSFNLKQACIQSERDALLRFKQDIKDPSNRLASWNPGEGGCCRWSGVICDNVTGNVLELHLGNDGDGSAFRGKISPSLLELKKLRFLDLSQNNFEGIQIPEFLGSMRSLRHLDLSISWFGGLVPQQLGNLSNLQYLNLRGSYISRNYVESLDWLSGLSSLEFLDLSSVKLGSVSNWLEMVNKLPALVELHFSFCRLDQIPPLLNVNLSSLSVLDLSTNLFEGPIPDILQNFTSLKKLDLSVNGFNSSIPNWLEGFGSLELLNLQDNYLQGNFSSVIANMTSLVSLDLSANEHVEGAIPNSFKTACNLRLLSLSQVNLGQDIDEIFRILSECISDGLESLSLRGCHVSGDFTGINLRQFKNLAFLDLSENTISGGLPTSFGELASLRSLYLWDNKLNGTLSVGFGGLKDLQTVDISSNSLQGEVVETHLANLAKLDSFYASGNNLLTFRVSPRWRPPFLLLRVLDLGSCIVGPAFPMWLLSLNQLQYLNLSNSRISGTVPIQFWNSFSLLGYLDLSQNQLQGEVQNASGLWVINLSSNNFSGPLPYTFSINVGALDVSNNSFSGAISNFLCYKMQEPKTAMRILNLGGNLFSGEIPDCWMAWPNLQYLRLSNNRFSGRIPMSIGNLSSLLYLHIRQNNLSGKIPLSIQNCKNLVTLDIGGNELVGTIPTWIGERVSGMSILSLRGNKFQGNIPQEFCRLVNLQILDLAHNSLSGAIPSCFNNFSAMVSSVDPPGQIRVPTSYGFPGGNNQIFVENMLLVMKGAEREYGSILGYVRIVDLSENNLSGEIPEEITSLAALQSLNLSWNLLSGKIPDNIGDMGNLEALDFSQNQLSGGIPPSMADLTFLSYLNLSYNNLAGRIPTGTQLQSQSSFSFIGNKDLCGPPLTDNCTGDGAVPPTAGDQNEEGDSGSQMLWFYVSMALGFVVGFWGFVGPLAFNRRWRYAYCRLLDRAEHRLWMLWVFKWGR